MRFLLDENQSPRIAEILIAAGHDAIHVRDLGLQTSPDARILAVARMDERVVVSADTDFGELLAESNADRPSLLVLRRQQQRRGREIAALILVNLPEVAEDLAAGAVVVFDAGRVRIRRLPFRPV